MATTAKIHLVTLSLSSKTATCTLPQGITFDRVSIIGMKTLQLLTHGDQSAATQQYTVTLCADSDTVPSGQIIGTVDWTSNLSITSPLVVVLS